MGCVRCGHCCTRVTFLGFNLPTSAGKEDMARYLRFHYLETYFYGDNDLAVVVPTRCKHLRYVIDGGKKFAACAIYDNRPQACVEYLCPLARGDVESG